MAFVTRSGAQLQLNGLAFRFGGCNIFWLGLLNASTYPALVDIDAAFSIAQTMGATVVRSHSLGISVGNATSIEPSLGVFNDAAFATIDYAVYKAGLLGLKLIIPLTDSNNGYTGWMGTFTGWRSVATSTFYTNATVIGDFEAYISHVLAHVNPYTGVALGSDPAIMMWETGNELNATGGANTNWIAWTTTIATYIKSLAPNHLVLDGFYYTASNNLASHLDRVANTATDACTVHYYNDTMTNYASAMVSDATACAGQNKVFLIGEYDWTSASGLTSDLLTYLSGIEGASANGDCFWNVQISSHPGDQYALYYPGPTQDVAIRTSLLRYHAWLMSGKTSLPTKFSSFSAHI